MSVAQGSKADKRSPVLMVGTDLNARGGVASVLNAWAAAGLFDRNEVHYVASNGRAFGLGAFGAALRCYARCSWLLLSRRVALVHVHHSSYISFWRKAPLFAMAMLMRKPLVVSLHGGAFKEFYSGLPTLAQWWQRRVMRYACRYLVLTESWRAWALQVEPRARVEVVPNIAPQIPADVPTYPVDAINPSLLFLGRVEPLKGVPELIAALAQAREAGARWNLVLAGEGAIEQTLEAARQKGLPPEVVRCVGWVDGEEKSQLLRACSAVVLPSHIENMPVAVVESFAYARPVVATRVGGVPDMVSDGQDGMLVSPRNPAELADALVSLWKIGGEARSVMGLAARSKCEQFYSANSLLERVEAAYSDCRRTE